MSSLKKTRGIVLSHIKYRESSLIARIFTNQWGLQSYLIHGARKQKSSFSTALFQPLTLLELIVYRKKQGGLQRISEAKCYRPNNNILDDIRKSTTAIFLAELLTKVVREEDKNEALFQFTWQSVIRLDEQIEGYTNFHIHFLLHLGHYLGFGITSSQELYDQLRHSGQYALASEANSSIIDRLIEGDYTTPLSKPLRRALTEAIVKFYQLHIETLDTLKSLKVLQVVSE